MKRCPQCGKQFASEANFCPVDAGRLEELPDEDVGGGDDHILAGRFVVGDRIGGGLTGQVFKAIDKESGHPCVVKWIDPSVFSSPLQLQRTERELKQLERQEAEGIARVLGHGRREEHLWVASEYVAGTPLNELVATLGSLPLERATKIVHDVGVALAEAAKLGVIHRDVAPKNVLVGDGDSVHLINFGVAVPATPAVRGIPEYVAPEQVDGKPVDQRSNIYSLGAMLFTLLTGRPPFEGDAESVHNSHLHAPPPHASELIELDDTIATELDRLLDRALAKQSSKRFMTLRQLLAELEKLAGIEPASTQRMSSTSASPPVVEIAPKGEGKGKGKGKGKRDAEAAQTLLGVAAFERPKADEPSANEQVRETLPAAGGVVQAVRGSESSGIASLAPPITHPPPMAPNGSGDPMPMQALAPATGERHDDADAGDDDAAATNALTASGPGEAEPAAELEPTAVPAVAPSALAQAQAAAHQQPSAEDELGRSTASGKRRRRKTKKKKKPDNKFRETMWFKKGELDEAAAEAAAAAADDSLVSAKADELPEDVRYKDDGTLSAADQERLSLRTGHTQMMGAMNERASMGESGQHGAVSDEEIAKEMTGGNSRLLIAGVVVLALIVIVIIILAK